MHIALSLFGLDVLQLDISTSDGDPDDLPHVDTLAADSAGFVDPMPDREGRIDVFARTRHDGMV